MADSEDSYIRDANSTAREAENVTAHDSNDFPRLARALRFGSAGNATIIDSRDNEIVLEGIQAGEVILIQCKRVNSTDLTAGNIVAIYN